MSWKTKVRVKFVQLKYMKKNNLVKTNRKKSLNDLIETKRLNDLILIEITRLKQAKNHRLSLSHFYVK